MLTPNQRFNKSTPCPICNKDHGCRVSTKRSDIIWCVRSDGSTDVTGFKFLHTLGSGMGGAFRDLNTAKVMYGEDQTIVELDDSTLNTAYRTALYERDLKRYHKNKLLDRGINPDWAEKKGFKTWIPNTTTNASNVPCINNGKLRGMKGFFIPATTPWGDLVGGQIAPDAKVVGKYLWLKGIGKARGSLPIFSAYDYNTQPKKTNTSGVLEIACLVSDKVTKVSAKVTTDLGAIVQATKKFGKLTQNQAELNALMLGLQLASGIANLKIIGVSESVKEGLSRRFLHDYEESFAIICREMMTDYWYEDGKPTLIKETKETKEVGESCFDTRTVYLVDGAAKAFYTAFKHKKLVFGHPMANFTSTKYDFERYLKAYAVENVIHAVDAGDVVNTAQIPAVNFKLHRYIHNLGLPLSIAWWEQYTKKNPDIDELEDLSSVKYLTADEFLNLHSERIQAAADPYKFHAVGIHAVPDAVPYPRNIVKRSATVFKEGDRIKALAAMLSNSRFVHDKSYAGAGKSFDFSKVIPQELGARKVLWVTQDPINLDYDVPFYRGRDNGRYRRDEDGRILSAPIGYKDSLVFEANCIRWSRAQELIERNVAPTSKKLCSDCPMQKECMVTKGMYHHDRNETLKQPLYRVHPSALSPKLIVDDHGVEWRKSESQKPGTVLILDDITIGNFFQTFTISPEEITYHIHEFDNFFEYIPNTRKAFENLRHLATTDEYLNKASILKHCGKLSEPETAIENLIEQEDLYLTTNPNGNVKKRWFKTLYDAFSGDRAYVHIYRGNICVTTFNENILDTILSGGVRGVVLADATGETQHYEQLFGVVNIPVISQKLPEQQADLEIIQVTGLGDCGRNKSERQVAKIEEFKNYFNELYEDLGSVIESKADSSNVNFMFSSDEDKILNWHGSSRGSNAIKDAHALLTVGTPRTNLGVLEAQYSLLTGVLIESQETTLTNYPMYTTNHRTSFVRTLKESVNTGFAEFCHRSTLAEFDQGFARLRSVRRPGQALKVYCITEFPLNRPVTMVDIHAYLPEEKKSLSPEQLRMLTERIESAAQEIAMGKGKFTKYTLAKVLGVKYNVVKAYFKITQRSWSEYKSAILQTYRNAETLTETVLQEMESPLYNTKENSDDAKTRSIDPVSVSDVSTEVKPGSILEIPYGGVLLQVLVIELHETTFTGRVITSDGMDVSRLNITRELPNSYLYAIA